MWSVWVWVLCVVTLGYAVERHKFKSCHDASFCERNRRDSHGPYVVLADTLETNLTRVTFQVSNQEFPKQKHVRFTVDLLVNDVVRVRANEIDPLHPRFELVDILEKPAIASITSPVSSAFRGKDAFQLQWENKLVLIEFNPLRIHYEVNSNRVLSFNSKDLFNFEVYRQKVEAAAPKVDVDPVPSEQPVEISEKTSHSSEEASQQQAQVGITADQPTAGYDPQEFPETSPGMWEETFGGSKDSKTKGPASFGADIHFHNTKYIFGLPEHASRFALQNTKGAGSHFSNPYRLYNLDVFRYELNEPMALYGSIPFILGHNPKYSSGIYWNNAAETFVDVFELTSDIKDRVSHLMSESGILDLFLFVGSNPKQIVDKYTFLTGRPQLPQLFSIAYHQCRWNYNDEADVDGVDKGFDQHAIPYDVLWLDIEHTDGKKYFTWDSQKFPNPVAMQERLQAKKRKMVTIIDPHIKRDQGYKVHKEAQEKGYYVKTSSGSDFEGHCWPGSSGYLDFLNPEVQAFWAQQFKFDSYIGSTASLYTWNDMNEPSVFSGPEVTMPKDCIHLGHVEHRDVHNLYGYYHHKSTYLGHLARNSSDRPFVLSRAFFAGSQKWGAMWTGDNTALWEHLEYSVPMLLSSGVAGFPFAGADIGGFFDNPTAGLLVRWYQVAAWQPFFRGHAHIDTKRREPWLFGEPYVTHIRNAVRRRYQYLPYLYTAFHEAAVSGVPVMRPLFFEFPDDESLFSEDSQFLVGPSILVKPVVSQDCEALAVRLPGKEPWYDIESRFSYAGSQLINVPTPMDKIPVFLKGGSIVVTQERLRRSSAMMKNDPYTLTVALNRNGEASGSLYIDDGKSFDYKNGLFKKSDLRFSNGILSGTIIDGSFACTNLIERIVVLGLSKPATFSVSVTHPKPSPLTIISSENPSVLTVRKPLVSICQDFKIVFAQSK